MKATAVEAAEAVPAPGELLDARDDLDGVAGTSAREGFPEPSARAFEEARRLLPILYRLRPGRIEVHPTAEGEIALELRGGAGWSVVVSCDSDGRVLCSVDLNGRHRRARYYHPADLPDAFVREALDDLGERPNASPGGGRFGAAAEPAPSEDDLPAELREARRDLDEVPEYADEEEFPQPSGLALRDARRLLEELYRIRPGPIGVYPTPDGEVALNLPGGKGRSVLILCGFEGGVLCSVVPNGRWRQAWYDGAADLPDGFLREALRDLGEQPGHAT